MTLYAYRYDFPDFGQISISADDDALTYISLSGQIFPKVKEKETPLILRAAEQLAEYFSGSRKSFSLPLNPCGTVFQKKVWQSLQDIPYGEMRSYKDIALAIGNPKACRAVGMANNRNPLAIIIPCHRVIGANGKLVGYAGGIALKQKLLMFEHQATPPSFSPL